MTFSNEGKSIETAKLPSVGHGHWESRLSWLAIALVILGASLVRLRLLSLPLERDEGEYAYMAQRLLHGVPPYVSAYSMKLPGIYAVYALNMLLFGQSLEGIHLGLVVVNAATILLMFILGRRLLGNFGGLLSGAAFAFLALGKPVLGLTVNAEHFVLLPLVGGLILLLRGLEGRRDHVLPLSGLLFGCALLMKQHGGFFIPFGALVIIWDSTWLRPTSKRALLNSLILFAGASAVPLALTCLIYLALGDFQKLWFWTVVFPRSYVTSTPLATGMSALGATFSRIVTWAPLLWLFAGVGLASAFLKPDRKFRGPFLLALLVFSFAATTPGLYFRGHYFILCLPAISLLAACGMEFFRDALLRLGGCHLAAQPSRSREPERGHSCPQQRPNSPVAADKNVRAPSTGISSLSANSRGYSTALSIALVLVVCCVSVFPQRALLFQKSPDAVSRELYSPDRFAFSASLSVAAYMKEHSSPNDKIAVIGSEPQIYFYLHRAAPTGFIYLYYLTEQHALTDKMQREFTAEIEAASPRYLVYSPSWSSELVSEPARVKLHEWYEQFVQSRYRIVGVAAMVTVDRTEYRWGEGAEDFAPSVRLRMVVYERKPGS